MPSNETTLLLQALVGKLRASDDLRYHISWAYGPFLNEVPRRIGTNVALDAAVTVFLPTLDEACVPSHTFDRLLKDDAILPRSQHCQNDSE